MSKTKIEWCDYSLNPVAGLCPMGCSYCYARRMYKRFKWDPTIYYKDEVFGMGIPGKPGDKYFVGSTMELFGPWVQDWWMRNIFEWVRSYPQRTFIFLTKMPDKLHKWTFPDNCWIGVSAIDFGHFMTAVEELEGIEAKVKFISLEPLLDWFLVNEICRPTFDGTKTYNLSSFMKLALNWIIIGRQTPVSAKTKPRLSWLFDIVEAADKAKIPVFLKDNLEGLLPRDGFIVPMNKTFYNQGTRRLRQEFPKVAR